MGILEKIADIEREIARTQKNKGTDLHPDLVDSSREDALFRSHGVPFGFAESEASQIPTSPDGRRC